MTNTLHIAALWFHILGIALFVGPQFFLAFAWPAASRLITDQPSRLAAMKTLTRRFGYIGGAGLLLVLIAGTYLIGSYRTYYHLPPMGELGFTEIRYGVVFIVKMVTLVVMLAVVGWHMFVAGPRLVRLLEAQQRGEDVSDATIRAARMRSMWLSVTGLLLTLAIMAMGVMMNSVNWSLQ